MFFLLIMLALMLLMGIGILLVGGFGIPIGFMVGVVCMEALNRLSRKE